MSFDSIKPTQSLYGPLAVENKIKKIEKKILNGEVDKYLAKKVAPVIIGPDKLYYIIDRHHTSIAIRKSSIEKSKKGLFIEIKHDWSSMTQKEFETKMIDSSYVWLKNEQGKNIGFEDLPEHIKDLRPYHLRSFSSYAKDNGCFEKVDIPYLEFYWADYFYKGGLRLNSSDTKDFEKYKVKMLNECHSLNASHMPGYIPPSKAAPPTRK